MERYVIKFTKSNEAKFISHLDTLRTLHRAFRRADLPISYSKGFNPHASISIAAPLSLGIESRAEYGDVELDLDLDEDEIKSALNNMLPKSIQVLKVIHINEKMPASMAAVEGAKYLINFDCKIGAAEASDVIKEIMDSNDISRMKRTKSGEKLVNLRPFIKQMSVYECSENNLIVECILQSGSRGSLGAETAAELIREFSKGNIFGYAFITREEIYTLKNDEWLGLDRYFTGK